MNERRTNPQLRKLILVGSLMAARLQHGTPARDLGATSKALEAWEQDLAVAWENELAAFRATVIPQAATPGATPAAIGRCDDCGLVDHHLVKGICPQCTSKTGGDHAPVHPV